MSGVRIGSVFLVSFRKYTIYHVSLCITLVLSIGHFKIHKTYNLFIRYGFVLKLPDSATEDPYLARLFLLRDRLDFNLEVMLDSGFTPELSSDPNPEDIDQFV